MLGEIAHLHARADRHLAVVGRGLAGHELEEGALAGAVHAHHTPALAAPDQEVEVVVDLSRSVAFRHVIELGDVLAGARRRAEVELDDAAALGGLDAVDLLQLLHPTLHLRGVARAGLEALDEGDLLGEHGLLARVLRLLLGGRDLPLLLVEVVVARIRDEITPVDLHDLCDESVQELPIMGRHDQRAVEPAEELFEPDDGLDVEVVGRLVEEERVGAHEEDAGQRDAHLPPAGELADVVVHDLGAEAEAGEDLLCARLQRVAAQLVEAGLRVAEALHQLLDLVRALRVGHGVLQLVELVRGLGDGAGACHRLFEHRAAAHLADVLAEVADGDVAIDRDLAAVGLLLLHDHAKDRGFAGSVRADEPHLFTLEDAHRRFEEEDLFAVLLGDAV